LLSSFLCHSLAGPANNNEDCLTLNVFTPEIGASSKLPVLVWIHGGGNMDGSSSGYDATRLAAAGKIVVVSINYRLGLLGWLANPALDAEAHPFANYGLLDQQLALKWVKGNIAAFGGDPGNVTLGGQSAGSIDTEANVASALATGLFQRAIFESVVLDGIPLQAAEKTGSDFAAAAGCGKGATPEVAACLRRLPVERIMRLAGTESTQGPYISILIADGQIVPASGLFAAFKNGAFTHMPIMSGTVHDEVNFIAAIAEYFSGPPRHAITAEQFQNFVTSGYPSEKALWHGGPGGIVHHLNTQQQRLSDALVKAWTNFARSGDPNGPGAPKWPVFRPTATTPGLYLSETLPVSETLMDQQFATDHKCGMWTKLATQ